MSTTFRPIVGNTVHFSDDRQAVKTWSDINQKRVFVLTVDTTTWTYVTEFDTCTEFDTIELLKTTEDGEEYYHVLLQSERLLGDIKIEFDHQKRKSRCVEEFDNFLKSGFSKMPRLDDVEMKPVQVIEDVHFKPDKPWI